MTKKNVGKAILSAIENLDTGICGRVTVIVYNDKDSKVVAEGQVLPKALKKGLKQAKRGKLVKGPKIVPWIES